MWINIVGIWCSVCLQEIDGDSELVCVHDSARPLVSSEDVKKVTPIVHYLHELHHRISAQMFALACSFFGSIEI